MSDILTAAEIEALQAAHFHCGPTSHYDKCELEHPYCALARLAASHLALERELQAIRETVGDEDFYLRQQLAAAQDALRFYADPHTYGISGGTNERIIQDAGKKAKQALRREP